MFTKITLIYLIILNVLLTTTKSHKIYFIENVKFLNWRYANLHCKKLGLNLLSIKTEAEFNYLKEFIHNEHGRIFPYWLGAYKVNDEFEWYSTGEKVEQFFWHKGQPKGKNGNERCIQTRDDEFDWNIDDCEKELPFICDLEL